MEEIVLDEFMTWFIGFMHVGTHRFDSLLTIGIDRVTYQVGYMDERGRLSGNLTLRDIREIWMTYLT